MLPAGRKTRSPSGVSEATSVPPLRHIGQLQFDIIIGSSASADIWVPRTNWLVWSGSPACSKANETPVAGSAKPICPPAPGQPNAVGELAQVAPKPAPTTTPIVRLAGRFINGSGSLQRTFPTPSASTSARQSPPGLCRSP